jgi:hypothetical protein
MANVTAAIIHLATGGRMLHLGEALPNFYVGVDE